MNCKFKAERAAAGGGLPVVSGPALIFSGNAGMVLAFGAAVIGGFVGVRKEMVALDPSAKVAPMEVHQELINAVGDALSASHRPAPGRTGRGGGESPGPTPRRATVKAIGRLCRGLFTPDNTCLITRGPAAARRSRHDCPIRQALGDSRFCGGQRGISGRVPAGGQALLPG